VTVLRFCLILAAISSPAFAADWPQFRGPASNGLSTETDLPVKWSKSDGIAWRQELPGKGVSSPVVVGGVVYVTCSSGPRDDKLHVMSFDLATGAVRWSRTLAATGSTVCHPTTCMAAPTPVATADAVYVLFATGDLAAFSRDGEVQWYRSLVGDYPTVLNQVGMAASPILAGGKLIVPMDNVGESFLAALDPKTGKNLWKVNRPKDMNWVSPIVRTANGKTEILFQAAKELVAFDVATGERIWGFKQDSASIGMPILDGDSIFVPGRTSVFASLGTAGPQPKWTTTKVSTGNSSAIVYRGNVYATSSSGLFSALDGETGNVLYQERTKGPFSAAPVAADGKIYLLNEAGTATVWKAGKEAELLATNDLGERTMGSMAIADGRIVIRSDKSIVCIRK
jgi:outer membrane protein assembly factor BamB